MHLLKVIPVAVSELPVGFLLDDPHAASRTTQTTATTVATGRCRGSFVRT